jgi:hypothetical protein
LLVDIFTKKKVAKNIEFLTHYFKTRFSHRTPLDWFDLELKPALGIDVYQTPFNLETGYQEYSQGNVRLLVVRSELTDGLKEKAVSHFVGFRIAKLRRQHTTADKIYSKTYQIFRDHISLEESIMDVYKQSAFMKTFYPDFL